MSAIKIQSRPKAKHKAQTQLNCAKQVAKEASREIGPLIGTSAAELGMGCT